VEAIAVSRAPTRATRASKNGIDKATMTCEATSAVLSKILNDFLFWERTLSGGCNRFHPQGILG